ncbi:MAG: hypothetical protein AAGF47_09535 [Planctomycetota bacterium]
MQDSYDPTDPVSMFDDLVPGELLLQITNGVRKAYTKAETTVSGLDRPEANDLRPHARRAHVETAIRQAAAELSEANLFTGRNAADNCSHRGIECNGVLLTGSLVDDRTCLPRNAVYRKGYARSRQGVLDFHASPANSQALLYAIVAHAPDSQDVTTPGFIDVIFPCHEYQDIVGRIRLLEDRFAAEFGHAAPATVETVPDIAVPRLRPAAAASTRRGHA